MNDSVDIEGRFIIGGAPSTGSSLLRRILNRHSKIYSGEESHLFAKQELYEDWDKNKSRIFKRWVFGLRSRGWHNLTGVNLTGPESIWSKDELKNLLNSTDSFKQFADSYFNKMLAKDGKSIYVDKTPANVFLINEFVSHFDGRCILTTRNPLDCIASMVSRGNSVFYATASCLIHHAFALKHLSDPNSILVDYDELVSKPKVQIRALCNFMKVPFEETMLNSKIDEQNTISTMEGWNYDETMTVGQGSMNRFDKLSEALKNQIYYACNRIKISEDFAKKNNLVDLTIKDLCIKMGTKGDFTKGSPFNLQASLLKDRLGRMIRSYPNSFLKYPIKLI